MLILSRRVGESITIEGGIKIVVTDINSTQVKIGIDAPKHINVVRTEIIGRDKGNH